MTSPDRAPEPREDGTAAPEREADPSLPAPAPAAVLHEPKRCRSCNAEILWAQLVDDRGERVLRDDGRPKAIPVDFAPSEKGNIRLWDRDGAIVARVLGGDALKEYRDKAWALGADAKLRMPHFAVCPQRDSWRRK